MAEKQKIIVASHNPVKINAVQSGFSAFFGEKGWQISPLSVPSGVRDQPFSNEETRQGAHNRVSNARRQSPTADFWVGIEGGVEDDGQAMLAMAWVVITGANGRVGQARTGTFVLPQQVAELVRGGKELGEADDIVFGGRNSKQKQGAVGLLTAGLIDRTGLYAHAVMLALIPFKNGHFDF
ncbi:MAG: inosine/xanthosine triphosphatase [Ardenticatenaceae bacterium]|nr:inosine/xanthosine triphosphatase [Ardenticatenaceae bacterium]